MLVTVVLSVMAVVVRLDWSEIVMYMTGGLVVIAMLFAWSSVQRHEPAPGVGGAMPYGGVEFNRASVNVYNHPSFDPAPVLTEMARLSDSLVRMNRDDSAYMLGLSPAHGGIQVVCKVIQDLLHIVIASFFLVVIPLWFWCNR